MTKRAALYCRVSTEEQAIEGYSIDAQKERLAAFCSFSMDDQGNDAYSIYQFYVDDGYSGRNTNRPGYRKMMEDIDEWDSVIVLKMDRIHRNTYNFLKMMDDLSRRGKEFVSATENLDNTTAMGRFVTSTIQNIAQLESEQIGERTYMGMREKASTLTNTPRESRTMGFNPPFGYEVVDGLLTGIRGELDVVKQMFEWCLGGESMHDIAEDVNRNGIRTHRGNKFTKFSVSDILHNPIYAGYIRWEELTYRHFASVPVDAVTFNRVQELLASRVKDPAKRRAVLVPEDDFENE
ncbi:Site-specific recombinase, DNA invertase [Thermoplasmatales archaeon BRNA1]|nr:Site-specific recombinase, DNA invertase [Thermoplasmatales archaeon BRNA1]